MKADRSVLDHLNAALLDQLTAINQFFLHARIFRNRGYAALDEAVYERSITAMKLSDRLIQRVLFLEGLPNLQKLGKLMIGEEPIESLRADLAFQMRIRDNLLDTIAAFEQARDFISRELIEEILDQTEDHIDWLETELRLADAVGVSNYLQTKSAGNGGLDQ